MLLNAYALKQAWLSLKKWPSFVAIVVTTMGATLGALTCVLTLAYLLIFQPLPYPDQERIYHVDYTINNELGERHNQAYNFPSLLHLYKNHGVFEQAAMAYYTKNVVTSFPEQPTTPVAFITPESFSIIDVPMVLGRRFDDREALDTEHQVAIINFKTWQNDFNGDDNVLSKTISFKGRTYKIIGVTAKTFVEPQVHRQGIDTAIWFPWDFHLAQKSETKWDRTLTVLHFYGKLPVGAEFEQAEQQLTLMMDDLWYTHAEEEKQSRLWFVEMQLTSLSDLLLGSNDQAVYLLIAGVFGLVFIAGTNITNLFVSRTAQQQSNLAIYAALGAKKSHLFSIILAETSLLMAASFLFSLLIASTGFHFMQNNFVELLPRVAELKVNAITVFFSLLFSAFAAVLFSLICRKMINYRQLNLQLQSSGKGAGIQVSKGIRQVLIVCQVAIATLLVFTNISLFKSAIEEINRPTGVNLENLYHTSFSVASPIFPKGNVVQPIMMELEQQLLQLPQVTKVDVSYSPLAFADTNTVMDPRTNEEVHMYVRGVGEQYFDMTQQQFLAGSMFEPDDYIDRSDDEKSATPVIINEALAKELFPNSGAFNQSLVLGDKLMRIVAVVNNTYWPGSNKLTNQMYFPIQPHITKMNIMVKPNQSLSRTEVVAAIKATTNLYALYGLERLTDRQATILFSQYATAVTTAVIAIITILLAAIGLYGILSYGTQMRRFELGTRMAIGAKGRDLMWLIIKENSNVILLGMLISAVTLLLLYLGFSAELTEHINIYLLGWYFLTLMAISALSLFACYWPLRQYITQPAIYSLRGAD